MTASPAPAPAAPGVQERLPAEIHPLRATEQPRAPRRRGLSAIVTTFNEAQSIGECLESLSWCDEILVVDSHSTDNTREIAARYDGVRVLERTYYGAASQKNWAIDRCRHDWILILDADERVTPELQLEVEKILAEPVRAGAYAINRRTHALGGRVRFSGWQHDRVTRFFRRGDARYPNRRVHADMETRRPPVVLEAFLDHHMVDSLDEYIERTRRYAWWGAAQLWRDGRRKVGLWQVLARPVWRFFRTWVLQLGLLEGTRGVVLCGVPAWGTFLKYATVWSWYNNLDRRGEPRLPEFDDDPGTWSWPENEAAPSSPSQVRV